MEHSLSSLINYRKRVSDIVTQHPVVRDSAIVQYSEFMQKIWNLDDIDLPTVSKISHQIHELINMDSDIKANLDALLSDIDGQLDQKTKELTIYHAMNLGLKYRSFTTYPKNKVSELTNDTELCNYVISQLESRVDFTIPGLILGGELVEHLTGMVGADPLYACMHESNFAALKTVIDNDFYFDSRLRKYPYDTFDLSVFDRLPQNQFGLIIASGHVDMQPTFNLQAYFSKIKSLLRPGGTFLFTFFDLDISQSLLGLERQINIDCTRLALIAQNEKTWWKNLELHPNCQKLAIYIKVIQAVGLKFVSYQQFQNQSVVVLQKYGDIATGKALQASGEIIDLLP